MPLRTPRLLSGLGAEDALDIALALLDRPQTIGQLAEVTGLSQPTVSRRVAALRDASVVEHVRRKGTVQVRDPDAVRRLLLAASAIAGDLAGADADDEAEFRRRLGARE
jgi:DNA-binding transcriptional ArsR family regulator